MKGIVKVFAVAAALAVLGLALMLAGFAIGGPTAARRAMDYTSLGQRHYQGDLPYWLERALGWVDGIDDDMDHFEDHMDNWADGFGGGMYQWADNFEDGVEHWADNFEDDVEHWADGVENWAEGYHHAGWHGGILGW